MAAFNVFLKEVTTNTWTAEGGTALEALGRETAEPTQPATAKLCKSTTISQKIEAKLKLPASLVTELEAGAKIIALTIHLDAKATAEEKRIKFGTVSPAVSSEPAIPIAQTWLTVSFTKAQAEEQTKATLEALVLLIEHTKANSASVYELYASIETEASGPKVKTLTASLTFAGTLQRSILQTLTAILTFAGTLPRNILHQLTAVLTFAGALGRNVLRQFAAGLSFAGSLLAERAGQFVRHLTASLTFQGNVERRTSKQLPASLTFTGSLQRTTSRTLTAVLSFAGGLRRTTTRVLTAGLTLAGSLPRSILARLKAALSFAGSLSNGSAQEPQIGTVALSDSQLYTVAITDEPLETVSVTDEALGTVTLSDASVNPG